MSRFVTVLRELGSDRNFMRLDLAAIAAVEILNEARFLIGVLPTGCVASRYVALIPLEGESFEAAFARFIDAWEKARMRAGRHDVDLTR